MNKARKFSRFFLMTTIALVLALSACTKQRDTADYGSAGMRNPGSGKSQVTVTLNANLAAGESWSYNFSREGVATQSSYSEKRNRGHAAAQDGVVEEGYGQSSFVYSDATPGSQSFQFRGVAPGDVTVTFYRTSPTRPDKTATRTLRVYSDHTIEVIGGADRL